MAARMESAMMRDMMALFWLVAVGVALTLIVMKVAG